MKEKDCFYDKLYKLLLQVGKSSSLLGGILSIIMFVLFFYLLFHLKFFSNDFLICLGECKIFCVNRKKEVPSVE
ncbi:hypothetical protein IQN02_03575 [Enterococcus faecium]|nr:hypothetical protein IQN02_03575 [Enterococcus faecium]